MAAEPTTRDALIAEMLGDIGRLHDSVEALKEVLPNQISEVETRITGLIGLLQKAGDAYKQQIEAYTNAQGEKIRSVIENDANAAKARFDRDSSDAIRAALADVARTVKQTVQTEVAGPVQRALEVQQQSAWKTLALCLGCGLLGGLAVAAAITLAHDKQDASYTALGKAVSASWEKLDSKAKSVINSERGPQ